MLGKLSTCSDNACRWAEWAARTFRSWMESANLDETVGAIDRILFRDSSVTFHSFSLQKDQ